MIAVIAGSFSDAITWIRDRRLDGEFYPCYPGNCESWRSVRPTGVIVVGNPPIDLQAQMFNRLRVQQGSPPMSQHDEVPFQDAPTPRDEQIDLLNTFRTMLQAVAADGGRKRAAGLKPSWKIDPSHEAALFSHLSRWKHGEKRDPDSGVHPLIHLAWRALARAWQETVR